MESDSSSDEDFLPYSSSEESSETESDENVFSRSKNLKLNNLKWTSKLKKITAEPFKQPIGPCHDLPPGSAEEDFFSLFIDEQFYNLLADETNKYAEYCRKKDNQGVEKWYEVSAAEIKAYIGILIFMGIVILPEIEDYFTSEFCDCPLVRKAMTRRRFQLISKFLHLTDEEEKPIDNCIDSDILYKVRPAINIAEHYEKYFLPGRELSIDEAMIKFKGRLHFKQYMPAKPIKWGIKVWVIADSSTGYVLGLQVYLGKKADKNEDFLLGEQVVLDLGQHFFDKYHCIYFDNFFTSLKLLQILFENKTYACGTFRNGRKGWPSIQTKNKKKSKKSDNLKRGESKIMQSGNFVATVWQDKKEVKILSCGIDPTQQVKKNNKPRNTVMCPLPVREYCQNMGGVDLADQKRCYYSVGRPSKKWWKYIFHFILNTSIVNSFVLYDLTNSPQASSHGNRQLTFRKKLAEQLIGDFTSRCGFPPIPIIPKFSATGSRQELQHILLKSTKSRRCRFCLNNEKVKRTIFYCEKCDIPICKNEFSKFHDFK